MGYGDEIIGSGLARLARARGKRAAFGNPNDGIIRWKKPAFEIFKNNPNVIHPDDPKRDDAEWIEHYAGKRMYHIGRSATRWHYNPDFRSPRGEMFFSPEELTFGHKHKGFVIIEPNVKVIAPNKQWPVENYQRVAEAISESGFRVAQFAYGGHALEGVEQIKTPDFRTALAVLKFSKLYIGAEGGLHHGAAAVDLHAVVIFGGFTHPDQTGYEGHANIFVGDEPCGSLTPCAHCVASMKMIKPVDVFEKSMEFLSR